MSRVYEYINSLIDMLDESDKFKESSFSILCDINEDDERI